MADCIFPKTTATPISHALLQRPVTSTNGWCVPPPWNLGEFLTVLANIECGRAESMHLFCALSNDAMDITGDSASALFV